MNMTGIAETIMRSTANYALDNVQWDSIVRPRLADPRYQDKSQLPAARLLVRAHRLQQPARRAAAATPPGARGAHPGTGPRGRTNETIRETSSARVTPASCPRSAAAIMP